VTGVQTCALPICPSGGKQYNPSITVPKQDITKDKSIVVELSNSVINPGEQVTLTIGFADGFTTVQEADAVGFYAQSPKEGDGAVSIAGPSSTLAGLAADLLTQIAASDKLKEWVAGSASGNVVTLTGIGTRSFQLAAATAAQAFREYSYGRATAPVQVDIWANSEKANNALTDALEGRLTQMTYDGLMLDKGGGLKERVLVTCAPPVELYDDLLKDL
jgi:hypothetical protein